MVTVQFLNFSIISQYLMACDWCLGYVPESVIADLITV